MQHLESYSIPEVNQPFIITDIRNYAKEKDFSQILSALKSGKKVFVSTSNNALYNHGLLRTTQKGIRSVSAEDALLGIGYPPDGPIAKLRRNTYQEKSLVLAIILNGNHRIGQDIISKKSCSFEVVLAEDAVSHLSATKIGLDFDDPHCLTALGLKTDPREIIMGYGFNTIVSKLIHYQLTGEILTDTTDDPINYK